MNLQTYIAHLRCGTIVSRHVLFLELGGSSTGNLWWTIDRVLKFPWLFLELYRFINVNCRTVQYIVQTFLDIMFFSILERYWFSSDYYFSLKNNLKLRYNLIYYIFIIFILLSLLYYIFICTFETLTLWFMHMQYWVTNDALITTIRVRPPYN